jgi:hypothetical protein
LDFFDLPLVEPPTLSSFELLLLFELSLENPLKRDEDFFDKLELDIMDDADEDDVDLECLRLRDVVTAVVLVVSPPALIGGTTFVNAALFFMSGMLGMAKKFVFAFLPLLVLSGFASAALIRISSTLAGVDADDKLVLPTTLFTPPPPPLFLIELDA